MNNLKFLLLLFCGTLLFISCKKDQSQDVLRHDEANFSAPALPAGTFIAGARFPTNIVDNYVGRNLTEVDFYIQDLPADCEIIIYGENTGTTPGAELYRRNVQSSIAANSWNSHVLDTPIEIKIEDLWIAVQVVHNSEIRSIGCDEGPARTNGDWMLGAGETDWKTYRELSNNQVSINWNIRGYISEE